jgi:hypothetical protein
MAYSEFLEMPMPPAVYYGDFEPFWQLLRFAWKMILWIIANPLISGLPMVGLGSFAMQRSIEAPGAVPQKGDIIAHKVQNTHV